LIHFTPEYIQVGNATIEPEKSPAILDITRASSQAVKRKYREQVIFLRDGNSKAMSDVEIINGGISSEENN